MNADGDDEDEGEGGRRRRGCCCAWWVCLRRYTPVEAEGLPAAVGPPGSVERMPV